MNALEFISSLVSALAWPGAVVAVALMFRGAIRKALDGRFKRVKAGPGGIELEYWEQTAATARGQLPEDAEQQAVALLGGGLIGELTQVAEVAPGAAVLEAFSRIERELRRITEGLSDHGDLRRMGARQLAVVAHQKHRISDQTLNAVNGLSVMRNLAAHGHAGELDTTRALEFVHLADAILFALSNESK